MNTPDPTPAPQKITAETHPELIREAKEGLAQSKPPTCTPSEGEKPACEHCGGSGVVSYSAGGESRLDECGCGATPRPTHSAQEAAERAAREINDSRSFLQDNALTHEMRAKKLTAIILKHANRN